MKILAFDLETSTILAHVWGLYDQNVLHVERDWQLLSFAYKWVGEDKITCITREGERTDKNITRKLWEVMSQADAVLAHNGDEFDVKKANAKFLEHGFDPPTPSESIDTLKIARRRFKLSSNKLNGLAALLGIGQKVKHTGIDLWIGCQNDDRASWKLMKEYNMYDVVLLEKVYLALRPWAGKHPNVASNLKIECPKCGSSKKSDKGTDRRLAVPYRRYQCHGCGGYYRVTSTEKGVARRLTVGL